MSSHILFHASCSLLQGFKFHMNYGSLTVFIFIDILFIFNLCKIIVLLIFCCYGKNTKTTTTTNNIKEEMINSGSQFQFVVVWPHCPRAVLRHSSGKEARLDNGTPLAVGGQEKEGKNEEQKSRGKNRGEGELGTYAPTAPQPQRGHTL